MVGLDFRFWALRLEVWWISFYSTHRSSLSGGLGFFGFRV